MADTLQQEINVTLSRIAILDDCLHELRSGIPASQQGRDDIADHIRWIREFLEKEIEDLGQVLCSPTFTPGEAQGIQA